MRGQSHFKSVMVPCISLDAARFALHPEVILRDESQYQHSGAFIARITCIGGTWYFDEVGFKTLVYLFQGRTYAEIKRYYTSLCHANRIESSEEELRRFMAALVERDILFYIPPGETYTPPRREPYLRVLHPLPLSCRYTPFSFPLLIVFSPFGGCNLRCQHCMASLLPRRRPNELSTEEIMRLITRLDELGLFTLKFTGGEITLHPDFWEILQCAASKRQRIILLTNSTRINAKNVGILADIAARKQRAFVVGTSLDGASAESHDWWRGVKGAFDRTLKAIRLMQEAGVPVHIQVTLNRRNCDEIEQIVNLIFSGGGKTSATFLIPIYMGRWQEKMHCPFSPGEIIKLRNRVMAVKEKYGYPLDFEARHTPKSATC